MTTETFLADIPSDLARSAYHGVSFDPEKRGDRAQSDYAETMSADYAQLLTHATTDEKRATLDVEFARYREGYSKRYRAYLASSSRCVSSFIVGPSNFPVRRMEKRQNVTHKRLNEFLEFRKRALDAIKKELHPEWRPIMSGDANATKRLQEKIAAAEKQQAIFKDVNAAIRKNRKAGEAAQIEAVAAVFTAHGFIANDNTAKARELLKPDFAGRIGFATFELTNNNANIKRMKDRLVVISRNQSIAPSEQVGSAATMEDCPADNRVRLTFPGKPDVAVRTRLKQSGFRWTPSLGAWQAYRHPHTIALAKEIAA